LSRDVVFKSEFVVQTRLNAWNALCKTPIILIRILIINPTRCTNFSNLFLE